VTFYLVERRTFFYFRRPLLRSALLFLSLVFATRGTT